MFSAKPPVNDAIICRTRRSFSFPVCGEISCARIFSRNEPHRESPPSVPETRHYFSGNRLETETCIIAVFLLDGSNTRFPSGAANISVAALIPAKFRFRRSIRLLVGPSSGASGFMPSFDRSPHAVTGVLFFGICIFLSKILWKAPFDLIPYSPVYSFFPLLRKCVGVLFIRKTSSKFQSSLDVLHVYEMIGLNRNVGQSLLSTQRKILSVFDFCRIYSRYLLQIFILTPMYSKLSTSNTPNITWMD